MDPTVNSQMQAGWGNLIQKAHINAEQDNRVIGAVLTRMLIQGGDPSNYADMQTASHVPTAQPYIAPNFITPAGNPVTGGS